MAYLGGIPLRSSETLRQWFKKLQWIIPGNTSRGDIKSNAMTILKFKGGMKIGEDLFPSQKNLDVIMNTLRRDVITLLRKSESSHLITILIYKLNILDNNIREICRYQNTWVTQLSSITDSLRVQERCVIRLIEEIMDDIFDSYSTMKRRGTHFTFNERNINGIISVLGILKREVCNMIHVIITSIEQHQRNTFYETVSPTSAAIENKEIVAPLPIESGSLETEMTVDNKDQSSKSLQVSLQSNRSYPSFEKSSGCCAFASLQDLYGALNGGFKGNSDYFNDVEGVGVPMFAYEEQRFSKRESFININNTKERGDGDIIHNDKSFLSFTSMRSPVQVNHQHESPPEIQESVSSFFPTSDKNKASLLYYDKEDIDIRDNRAKVIKENYTTLKPLIDKRKIDNRGKQDCLRDNLLENSSRLSWPNVTVVRDIKSDMHLNGPDRSGKNENCSGYDSNDEIAKDEDSDSDSDASYISCALDEFTLDLTFFNHLKEKFLQEKPYKAYEDRNNTQGFSCTSPKLSEIFTGPRLIRRKEDRTVDVYHSVESLPALYPSIEEPEDEEEKESKEVNEATCPEREPDIKAIEYKKGGLDNQKHKKEPRIIKRTIIDSFNTLALSEDYNGPGARYTESIASFASVGTETVDKRDKGTNVVPNECRCKFSQKQREPRKNRCGVDTSPHLEDSQYSSICLSLPQENIRLVNIDNQINLLAIEVEEV